MNLDPTEIARLLPLEGRYELRRRRWLDGPHESWEAFDRVLEREVVVNRAYPHFGNLGLLRRAKVGSGLTHPNILPVFDLGLTGEGLAFFTTPLSRAVPLDERLRRLGAGNDFVETPFPLGPLVSVVRDACRAVEYLHRHGLLHLDLHPGGLLVGEGFRDMLLDHDHHDWKGREDVRDGGNGGFGIVGRPAYMSPERVNEGGPGVGPATDVFGLGGILHVLLFGTPPNHLPERKSPVEVIRAIAERTFEPRRPGPYRAGIRSSGVGRRIDGLAGICLKALAYEPEARFPSAAKMGEAIEEWGVDSRSARMGWLWRR